MASDSSVSAKIVMVAALEREIWPLVKNWTVHDKEYAGREFRFFENEGVVAVCGGIGFEASRRASEAAITLWGPGELLSVGFAGALDLGWKVGRVFEPGRVLDARDGSSFPVGRSAEILVSFGSVASVEQKRKLAEAYGAQAVDMEAAAVANAAQAHRLAFRAVKVISDELDFELPGTEGCVSPGGQFRTGKFVASVVWRPWLWSKVFRLARNSSHAAEELSRSLRRLLDPQAESNATELHPISGARI